MRLKDIYNSDKTQISFEVFPPKGDDKAQKIDNLISELNVLKKHNPALISITYGACGTNRESTIEIAKRIKNEVGVIPMQHFTCICSQKQYIHDYLKEIESMGLENILALKGDEPKDNLVCYKDFAYANELVQFIRENSSLDIAVAGYPEKHPTAPSLDDDIKNLKRKCDAGASVIFTQMFFENDNFFKYQDKVRKIGVNLPIVAGIFPISDYKQITKIAEMSGAYLPKMLTKLEKYQNSKEDTMKFSIEYSINQCQELIENGVSGLHFYTLNKSYMTSEIIENLSL